MIGLKIIGVNRIGNPRRIESRTCIFNKTLDHSIAFAPSHGDITICVFNFLHSMLQSIHQCLLQEEP